MSILCNILEHKWVHIANFTDVSGGRALYQCERCKEMRIAAPAEFYLRNKARYVKFTKWKAYYKI
jgi:hypothetical protein